MSWFQGKKVFISGGSAGIGRATAELLAKQGASVFIIARGEERLKETVAALVALGAEGQVFGSASVDVTQPDDVKNVAAQALEQLGGLDVLICNSGFARTGTTDTLEASHYTDMLDVNYLGHVNVVRAFLPHFIAQKHGDISLVTSMMGFMSVWAYGAYSASKFAIVGFAEALRQEMLFHDVRVTLFYPTTTKTPGLEAENESKPPLLWQLESESAFNKTYEASQAAEALLKGVRKGRFINFCGFDTWLVYTANRLFPGFTRWMSDGELRKAAKKVESKKAAD
ncbi:MAG: hypothetical protein AUK47_08625 [Deltaproteobacteria bacterium CG2_30_63_29]|nr:MAG: hypothetical protein AUK47_08625 [Deltaproteobacteria bacterium CG2_30_63_29]PJB35770.1 MAG: short-chain dehydrogenase [Deltaproteobacteria bacterium CG_4_9_14_3_um_filter_63_12]